MEQKSDGFLSQALGEEAKNLPEELIKKINVYYEENVLNPFIKAQALAETYGSNIGE